MHSLNRKRKKRKKMKKFEMFLSIEGMRGTSTSDVEERLRTFIFNNRKFWKLGIISIREMEK